MKGTIYYKDPGGKTSKSVVLDVTDKTSLGALVASLDSFTNCAITGYSVVDYSDYAGTTDPTGKLQSVEAKADMKFVNRSDPENRLKGLKLPAPADVVWADVDRVGPRVVQAQGEALAAMLSTATGLTLEFKSGKIRSITSQSQA